MHGMYKMAVDATFSQITDKKGIKRHGKRAIATIYKYYTKLEDMEVMGLLYPDSITRSQKKWSTASNKPDKGKKMWKTKRKDMRRCQSTKVLHA